MKKIFIILTVLSLSLVLYFFIPKSKTTENQLVNYDKSKNEELSRSQVNAYEEKLIASLNSSKAYERWNAAVNLGIMNSQEAVPYLIKTCKDPNPQVRMLSLWSLGKIRAADAIDTMEELLPDPDVDVRPFAIWALGETGDNRAALILEKSYGIFNEYGNQQLIISSLGKIASPSSLPFLLEKINDENQLVSLNAIEALGRYREKNAEDALLGILKNGKREQVIQALRVIKKFGGRDILPAIYRHLNSTDESIRIEAERAAKLIISGSNKNEILGQVDPLEKREALMEENAKPILEVPDLKTMNPEDIANFGMLPIKASQAFNYELAVKDLQSGERSLTYDAVWRMGNSGDLRVVPLLISAMQVNNDRGFRWNAAKALGKLKDKRAVPSLIELINESNPEVREDVVEALGRIGDKRAVKPLLDMLQKEEEDFILAEIVIAEGLIGIDKKEVATLTTLLKKDDPIVKANILLVLGKYGDESSLPIIGKYTSDPSEYVAEAAKRAIGALKDKTPLNLEDHYHEM